MFQLLFDAARRGCRGGPLPRAHFFCDGTPFGHRIGMLEQVLVGEVVNAHRLFAGKSVSGRYHGNARLAEQR
jgi:hypothetical protein